MYINYLYIYICIYVCVHLFAFICKNMMQTHRGTNIINNLLEFGQCRITGTSSTMGKHHELVWKCILKCMWHSEISQYIYLNNTLTLKKIRHTSNKYIILIHINNRAIIAIAITQCSMYGTKIYRLCPMTHLQGQWQATGQGQGEGLEGRTPKATPGQLPGAAPRGPYRLPLKIAGLPLGFLKKNAEKCVKTDGECWG